MSLRREKTNTEYPNVYAGSWVGNEDGGCGCSMPKDSHAGPECWGHSSCCSLLFWVEVGLFQPSFIHVWVRPDDTTSFQPRFLA